MSASAPVSDLPVVSEDFLAMVRKRGMKDWVLEVTEVRPVTPRMRRVSLTAENLAGFEGRPGQDLLLMLADGTGEPARRHYSIRGFDPGARRIDIDVVLHGDSTPGTRWALGARAGDRLRAFGPRGRNVITPGADWRLFVTDETGLPPAFAMLESLPAGARAHAVIEVADDDDRQPLTTAGEVTIDWISRKGAHAEPSSPALIAAAAAFDLPPGLGHVYLLGETSTIRRLRHDLIARGIGKDQIFGEGYWRPGRVGGHDHLAEH